jgi:ketosteroid isomerase-like protein
VEVVKKCYEAFGRGDVPAILQLVAEPVDWKFIGAKKLPYSVSCRNRKDVEHWFASVAEADDLVDFEPREFIPAGEHVTVLGWERTAAKPGGKVFESEWAHVFTVREGRVVRFWGIYDSEASAAARK